MSTESDIRLRRMVEWKLNHSQWMLLLDLVRRHPEKYTATTYMNKAAYIPEGADYLLTAE